jgi:hypothetical protein
VRSRRLLDALLSPRQSLACQTGLRTLSTMRLIVTGTADGLRCLFRGCETAECNGITDTYPKYTATSPWISSLTKPHSCYWEQKSATSFSPLVSKSVAIVFVNTCISRPTAAISESSPVPLLPSIQHFFLLHYSSNSNRERSGKILETFLKSTKQARAPTSHSQT